VFEEYVSLLLHNSFFVCVGYNCFLRSYLCIVILVNDTTFFIVLWVNILSSLTHTHTHIYL